MPARGETPHPAGREPEPREFVPADYFRRLEPGELFPDSFEVDLGSGDESFLLALARHFPERHFLGVERLLGRVRKTCRQAQREHLDNVRVLRLEARYSVEWLLPLARVDRLHLLFPDPWPKARHHRRRLVNQAFLAALDAILAPGGEFLFKTDHGEYHEWVTDELNRFSNLRSLDWPSDEFFYPETDFERQWRAEHREVFRLRCQKGDASGENRAPGSKGRE